MRRLARRVAFGAIVMLAVTPTVQAEPLRAAGTLFAHGDFIAAAKLLRPMAERGNCRAEAMLGFMFETGQGVPQAYDAASYWYRRGAEHGDPRAQYLLGLAYDKGHGVPRDEIAAYKWLNLAAAHAPPQVRDKIARVRNAVASKMSRKQIAAGQWHAMRWPDESDF